MMRSVKTEPGGKSAKAGQQQPKQQQQQGSGGSPGRSRKQHALSSKFIYLSESPAHVPRGVKPYLGIFWRSHAPIFCVLFSITNIKLGEYHVPPAIPYLRILRSGDRALRLYNTIRLRHSVMRLSQFFTYAELVRTMRSHEIFSVGCCACSSSSSSSSSSSPHMAGAVQIVNDTPKTETMYRLAALALLATSVTAKGGCPSTDLTLEDWIGNAGGTHGACMTDDHCQNDGECCVNYHVGYCGVPSDCNEFLQCRGAGNGAAFSVSAMSDTPATNEEFQALLARADGGGAYYDGCPPRSETWEGYLAKGGACTTNLGCATDNPGSCCVRYTFPYCGVPSACNEFLQCLSPGEEAAAVTAAIDQGASPVDQSEAFAAAFEKLEMMGAGNETDPGMGAGPPDDTTSPGAFSSSSGFMGFSVVALVVGLFV